MDGANGIHVEVKGEAPPPDIDANGDLSVTAPDGSVVVTLGVGRGGSDESAHYDNLVERIEHPRLSALANDIHEAIAEDDRSRQEWLANRARMLELLGLETKPPKGDVSSAVEGMSTVTSPLMLDALLKGWAGAVGEFLPANGPVKVTERNDAGDEQADVLEKDFNWWLLNTATEYYPDTSHMLLWGPFFGGSGFKKVYRCPLKRRPTSESVDPQNLIVSNAKKDFASCERVTHEIEMRPSVMKRMQLAGAYRDVELIQPLAQQNIVDAGIAAMQGIGRSSRPEDQPYTVWECQCELVLDEFAPKDLKGVPLPYLMTIDKDSREVLALRRDWEEDDELAKRETLYVKYPFVPGPGFYGTGLASILGNSTAAMTAAWREALDAGMYASFPAGFIDKMAARQTTGNFRLPPGEFAPIDTGGRPIGQLITGMPYHDVTPGLMQMMDRIEAQCSRMAGSPTLPTDEGVSNVPVGSMLAQVEQATKVLAAAHKGMHTAQREELALLLKLFRRQPKDFVDAVNRGNEDTPTDYWDEAKLLAALENYKLAPASDPNVPSHLHRIMTAWALVSLSGMPQFMSITNQKEVYERALRAIRIEPEKIVVDAPAQQGPDPKVQAEMVKAQSAQQTKMAELQAKAEQERVKTQAKVEQDAAGAQLKATLAQQSADHKAGIEEEKANRQAHIEATQAQADITVARDRNAAEAERAAQEAMLKERLMLMEFGMRQREHEQTLETERVKAKAAAKKGIGSAQR